MKFKKYQVKMTLKNISEYIIIIFKSQRHRKTLLELVTCEGTPRRLADFSEAEHTELAQHKGVLPTK